MIHLSLGKLTIYAWGNGPFMPEKIVHLLGKIIHFLGRLSGKLSIYAWEIVHLCLGKLSIYDWEDYPFPLGKWTGKWSIFPEHFPLIITKTWSRPYIKDYTLFLSERSKYNRGFHENPLNVMFCCSRRLHQDHLKTLCFWTAQLRNQVGTPTAPWAPSNHCENTASNTW